MNTWIRAGVAFMLAGPMAGCHASESYQKPLTPVLLEQVHSESMARTRRYSAVVEPVSRVDLAFRVGGYVTSLARVGGRLIQEGDPVASGAILASVRAEDFEARVSQARAAVAEAEAARVAASSALARAEALYGARSLTKPELEQARATLASIDARLAGARAVVREAELTHGDVELRSPISGTVLRRAIEVGSLVVPGTPAFTVADASAVRVIIGVPDTVLRRFQMGAIERVTSDAAPGRRFEGRITKVSPSADQRSRLFDVELTVPNADGALRPGMVATLDAAEPGDGTSTEAITVPLTAVVRAPGGGVAYAVFVVEQDQGEAVARVRAVHLGDLVGNRIAVLGGLAAGERVIVRGATIVTDGERVNPAP
jgi:RND family efflux transporter MFP subunit